LSDGDGIVLTEAQMQKLVSDFKIEPKPSQLEGEGIVYIGDASSLTPERMEEFLTHCDVNFYPAEPYYQGDQGGVRYVIEACPWTDEHSGKDLKKDAAVFVLENGQFGFNCFHAHCAERGWKAFREKVSEGKKKFSFVDTGNITVGGKNKLEQVTGVTPTVKMRTMASVKAEPLEWLWYGRVPKGSLVIFAGDPSKGKSIFTFDFLARLSKGEDFIDGGKNNAGPVESIIMSCEDDPNMIIKPRLELAGADCTKIHLLETITDNTGERIPRLDKDLNRIANVLQENPNVRCVVIDPVSNYVGQKDMHKDQDMRSILTPLANVARDYGVSVIMIWHNNKTKGGTGLQKVGGSLGMHGVARMGWAFMEHEDEPNVKVMLQIKENYGKFPGIMFETQGQDVNIDGHMVNVPRVAFKGLTEADANILIAKQSDYKQVLVKGKKFDTGKAVFLDALKENGGKPIPSAEMQNIFKAKGIFGKNAVADTAVKLGLVSKKVDGAWCWLKDSDEAQPEF
jgi:AAA domain